MTDSTSKTVAPNVNGYDLEMVHHVETKWRESWLENKTFRSPEPKPNEKTFFCLDMFPYPSGDGLHVGHPVGFIASDVMSRFKRMKEFNVLHPMGWDAFGLPAERHAMKTGLHPAETVKKNSANYRRQMELIGLSFDWDREISTVDPSFYQFTQSMFLDLYEAWFNPETQRAEHIDTLPIPVDVTAQGDKAVEVYKNDNRLAYYDEAMVNFCPELGSVVANEEVMADGRTEQGYEVQRRLQRQMMMRISSFAERLISGLEGLDWPEAIKEMQRNWIGRSQGHRVTFPSENGPEIVVYTTRADTLPGTTFLAIAPEHPLIGKITAAANKADVDAYVETSLQKSELSRKQGAEKTGVATGYYATNPLSGEAVQVYVSDYVLPESGTGAVMGVPAHDARDFEFAKLKDIPIVPVLAPEGDDHAAVAAGEMVWTGAGQSLPFDLACYSDLGLAGLPSDDFAKQICDHLVDAGIATTSVQYRIRDWIFSRQRYWGEPIPLVHWEDGEIEPLPRNELPLVLPVLENYKPSPNGEPPLARAEDWCAVVDPKTGRKGTRETLTMPQWAGSCWYPLRYMDPANANVVVDPDLEERWGPVDLYIGGAEHATLHLLYARFWYMALADLGTIKTAEPFKKLVNQGMLLSFTFKNSRGVLIPVDEVEERDDGQFYIVKTSAHYTEADANTPLERVKAKMSKSLRNVVTPDQVVEEYGADAYRVSLMFMGPVEQLREWENSKAAAAAKFLRRFWKFVVGDSETGIRDTIAQDAEDRDIRRTIDEAVSIIEEGIEGLRFNTSIATVMKALNQIGTRPVSKQSLESLVLIFSPFAPFMCEELWARCGNTSSLARHAWPEIDTSLHDVVSEVPFVITIGGKKRAQIDVSVEADDATLEALAMDELKSRDMDIQPKRVIVVRDKKSGQPKLLNIIV